MTLNDITFQPGRILHDANMGAFKAHGVHFEAWCQGSGLNSSLVRNATYGQSGGKRGKDILEKVIDAAGRDYVRQAYVTRMADHVAQIKKVVA